MHQSRRNFIGTGSAAFLSLLFVNPLKANGILSKLDHIGGEVIPLRRNVGLFKGRGGTMGWLVDKNSTVVIDSQFPPTAQELMDELKKKTASKFDFLINTHHHGDHTAGNIVFKDHVHNIIAHENSKINQKRVAVERGRETEQAYPNMVFTDQWRVDLGNETILCSYHGRGHTNGDIITHFENANVVHMGDLIFNRRFPYIDKGAGAHIGNWTEVLEHSIQYFDSETIFIFGHSGDGYDIKGTKEDIKAFQNYLEKLLVSVEKAVKAGKTLEEIETEMKTIPGADEWKGDGISRSLSAAYTELTTEQ